jgi:predicted nucleic acid-binding protein
MNTYIDSSAIVPVYVPEQLSDAARSAVRSAGQVPFTAIHHLEVSNAFEQLVGRGLVTRDECRAIQSQLRDDVASQRLVPLSIDLEDVFARAAEFSRAYTATHLTRSLDLLHVAAAHVAGCGMFVSADDRQLAVADASGLEPVDIKRRPRSRVPCPGRRSGIQSGQTHDSTPIPPGTSPGGVRGARRRSGCRPTDRLASASPRTPAE